MAKTQRTNREATTVRASANGARVGTPVARSAQRGARPAANRRRQVRQWWQTPWAPLGAVAVVALIVVLFMFAGRNQQLTGSDQKPVSASVLTAITHVSPTVSSTVGRGTVVQPFTAVSPAVSVLKGKTGKPEVLYVGAEYCPYCAAQRWSMIVALSRFGTFSNLRLTTSSSSDTYPDTPSFTFRSSSYTSQYVDLETVEIQDRNHNNLEKLSKDQQALFDKYDAPPYISAQNAGAIPFIDIGNQYVEISSGYLPDIIGGQSWDDIAKALNDPNAESTKAIVGTANYITAGICQTTNNQPASVCTAAPIPDLQKKLPKAK